MVYPHLPVAAYRPRLMTVNVYLPAYMLKFGHIKRCSCYIIFIYKKLKEGRNILCFTGVKGNCFWEDLRTTQEQPKN